jgi:hypothetical protein
VFSVWWQARKAVQAVCNIASVALDSYQVAFKNTTRKRVPRPTRRIATEAYSQYVGVAPTQHPLTWVPGSYMNEGNLVSASQGLVGNPQGLFGQLLQFRNSQESLLE